jgi:DNA end-binding protein Ku
MNIKLQSVKTVMGSHETLMAIIPREDGIIIQTMHFEDEIKEIPKTYKQQVINEEELTMAKMLINSMNTPFDPTAYKDEYQKNYALL